MKSKPISQVIIFVFIIPFFVNGQELITGSTTSNSIIVPVISYDNIELIDMIGDNNVDFGFIKLYGEKNQIEFNIDFISAELNLDDASGKLITDLRFFKIILSGTGSKYNSIGIQGNLGTHTITLTLDFEPGLNAITSSTAANSKSIPETKYKIIITDRITGFSKSFGKLRTSKPNAESNNEVNPSLNVVNPPITGVFRDNNACAWCAYEVRINNHYVELVVQWHAAGEPINKEVFRLDPSEYQFANDKLIIESRRLSDWNSHYEFTISNNLFSQQSWISWTNLRLSPSHFLL